MAREVAAKQICIPWLSGGRSFTPRTEGRGVASQVQKVEADPFDEIPEQEPLFLRHSSRFGKHSKHRAGCADPTRN